MYLLANDAWLNTALPEPSMITKLKNGYNLIGYAINGFMGTEKNKRYARDVILKIKKALEAEGAEDVKIYPFFPDQRTILNKNTIINPYIYDLDELNIPVKKKFYSKRADLITKLGQYCNTVKETEDYLFDAIRFTIYDFVKFNSKDALTLDYVNLIAIEKYRQLGSKKGESTARAKAKAIYRWVIKNYNPGSGSGKWNWNYVRKTKNNKELKMVRAENAKKQAEKKYKNMHAKIVNLVTGLMSYEYKKKDGTIKISKVARDLGISRTTVYKHLKDANLI